MKNLDKSELQTEKELFGLIAKGDEFAFAKVFESHYQSLFWHAYKLLRSEFWAEEVVQEIFTQLWVGREHLSHIENPSSYLFKMTANKALDRIRKHQLEIKAQYFLSLRQDAENLSDTNELRDQLDAWLLEAIDNLPEQRKRIYTLKYQQGLSYDEIAQALSISKNTVRNQMVKALDSIRSYLLERKVVWILLGFFLPIS